MTMSRECDLVAIFSQQALIGKLRSRAGNLLVLAREGALELRLRWPNTQAQSRRDYSAVSF
jgi:hypothetical protein